MDRPRLALLNASYNDENTRRNFRRELAADLAEFDVNEGVLPQTFDFDGVVVTGSRASVYWDEPWIEDLLEWVIDAVDRDLPCLGICYGHQVFAEALGGTVESMDDFEIGYRDINRVGDSRLLEGLDTPFTAFTTHGDAVVELPPGANPIAENEYSNHGFELGEVWTVQFHPEYDMETAAAVTQGKDFLDDDRLQAVLDDITDEQYASACRTKRLFDNFVDHVRSRRHAETKAARS